VDTDASSAGYQPGSVAGHGGTGNCALAPGGPPRAGRPSPTGRTSVFSVGIPGQRPGVRGTGPVMSPRLVTILPGVPDTADETRRPRPAFPRKQRRSPGTDVSGEPGDVTGEPGDVTGEPGDVTGEPGDVSGRG
jgi:hypothetical protein